MSVVTRERWARRADSKAEAMGLDRDADFDGLPMGRRRAWGLPLVKRMERRPQTAKAIDGGWQFDMSPTERIVWRDAVDLRSFETEAGELAGIAEHGAQRGEIHLSRRPDRARWTYLFAVPRGVRFVFQPADPDAGGPGVSYRPPAIRRSQAVFGPGGEKLAHILAPKMTDARGRTIWGGTQAHKIDREAPARLKAAGLDLWRLTIGFARRQVRDLRPPLAIDGNATVGYTSKGGTASTQVADTSLQFGPFAMGSDGQIDTVYAYVKNSTGGSVQFTLGWYHDTYDGSAHNAYNLGDDSSGDSVADGFDDWHSQAMDNARIVDGDFNIYTGANQDGELTYYRDSVAGYDVEYKTSTTYSHGSLRDPAKNPTDAGGYKYSTYAVTSAIGGGGGGGRRTRARYHGV